MTTTANKGEDVQRTVSFTLRFFVYFWWVGAIYGCGEDPGEFRQPLIGGKRFGRRGEIDVGIGHGGANLRCCFALWWPRCGRDFKLKQRVVASPRSDEQRSVRGDGLGQWERVVAPRRYQEGGIS